jgi:hypothetical protein
VTLNIAAPQGNTNTALDAGRVIVRGPTNRTQDAVPGSLVRIDGLQPGRYTVALEGLVTGEVERFVQANAVDVRAGDVTTVTISNFPSFVPVLTSHPDSVVGTVFTVTYQPIADAARYIVAWTKDRTFATGVAADTVTGTSVPVTVPDYARYYLRVRAVDAYDGLGRPSVTDSIRTVAADLVISGWGVPPVTPTGVPPGGTVTLSGSTVTNQGTVASNAYRIGFYLSGDSTLSVSNDVFLSGQELSRPALAAGNSVTIPQRFPDIPPTTPPGDYFIGPLLDDQNGTAESNEGNNFRSARLTVLRPDQMNDPPSGIGYGGCAGSLYQSFTPTRSLLTAVQIRLRVGGGFPAAGTNTSINIRSGSPAGPILGTSSVSIVGPQSTGRELLILFQFSAPISVTAGSSVVIEWPNSPVNVLNWLGSDTNPYSGGTMFGCGQLPVPGTDLNFITF